MSERSSSVSLLDPGIEPGKATFVKRTWLAFPVIVIAFASSADALTRAGTTPPPASSPASSTTPTIAQWQSQLVNGLPTVPFVVPIDLPVQAPLQPGQIVNAAYTPFSAPMQVSKNNAYGLLSNILAGAQSNFGQGYQTIPVANTAPQHPAWEADGYAATTCDEFAYKRYYDYRRFQEAAATCGGNPDCVYNLWASTGPGGWSHTLLARSGRQGAISPVPGSVLDPGPGVTMQQLKNPMRDPNNVASFLSALQLATEAGSPATSAQQAAFTQLNNYLSSPTFANNPAYYPITGSRAAWHVQMFNQQQQYGETSSERALIQQRIVNVTSLVDAYNAAVSNYNAASAAWNQAIIQACGGLTAPNTGNPNLLCTPQTPQYCNKKTTVSQACTNARNDVPTAQLNAEENAAVALATALYREYTNLDPVSGAPDNGCLGVNHNKCDWSPSLIGPEYLTSIDAAVQKDLSYCDGIVGTGTTDQLNGALQQAEHSSTAVATDDEVDTYNALVAVGVEAHAFRTELDFLQTDPDTIHYDLFSGPQSWSVGGDFASASYSQNAFWEVHGKKNAQNKLCRVSGRVYGSANASAKVLGQSITVIDADLQIGAGELVNNGGATSDYAGFETESHLTIGPYSIYSFPDSKPTGKSLNENLAHQHFDQNIVTVQGQIYLVNLVLQVDAVADVDVSLTGSAPTLDCASVSDASQNAFNIGANVTPSVSAQMVGTALVGALGTGVGVQGTVDLVTAALPINVNAGIGPDASGAGELALNFDANASLDISVLSGEVDTVECIVMECAKQELFRWNGIPAYSAPNLWNLKDSFSLIAVQTALQ